MTHLRDKYDVLRIKGRKEKLSKLTTAASLVGYQVSKFSVMISRQACKHMYLAKPP